MKESSAIRRSYNRPATGKGRRPNERGVYFILMCVGIVALLAVVGFGIDAAKLYRDRLYLQKAADAGVIAGLAYRIRTGPPDVAANQDALRGDPDDNASVMNRAKEIAIENCELGSMVRTGRTDNAEFYYNTGDPTVSSTYDETTDTVRVTLRRPQEMYLLDLIPWRVFGAQQFDGVTLTVTASGKLRPARVAMLLDFSGSMCCEADSKIAGVNERACMSLPGASCTSATNKAAKLREAADKFFDKFRSEFDHISLVPYNIGAKVAKSIDQSFVRQTWKDELRDITPASDTNPSDALLQAYLDARNSYQSDDINYVVFSDGAPTAARLLFDITSNPALEAHDPNLLAAAAGTDLIGDYQNYKVTWQPAAPAELYPGPSSLIKTGPHAALNLYFGYPLHTPPAAAQPTCTRFDYDHTDTPLVEEQYRGLSDCLTSFGFRLPFNTTTYGANVPRDSLRWSEQYYNAPIALADLGRQGPPGTTHFGRFYVVGLGVHDEDALEDPHPDAAVGVTPDPYQNSNADFARKDYFLARLALDRDLCPLTSADCSPEGNGATQRPCCATTHVYQQDFHQPGLETGLNTWSFYGVVPGSHIHEEAAYDNRHRFGEYLATNDANELTPLFERVAMRIMLQLIS